jgi:putative ABC transport system permease protein
MERVCEVDLGRENRKMKRTGPLKIAEKSLSILSPSRKTGILGDAEEEYRMILSEKGRFRADVWYAWQIFRPLPFLIRSSIYWSIAMLKNYLLIAFRNIKKHKGFSFINISGLAVGIACFFLIMLYVQFEMSYDKFHKNSDRIYRAVPGLYNYVFTPPPLAPKLKEEYPEIESIARISRFGISRRENKFWRMMYSLPIRKSSMF